MKILIKNAIVIPMNNTKEKILYGVDIFIQDDKIIKIEKDIRENADKSIDATRKNSIAWTNQCTCTFTYEHI